MVPAISAARHRLPGPERGAEAECSGDMAAQSRLAPVFSAAIVATAMP
jgi:hypothetical protein